MKTTPEQVQTYLGQAFEGHPLSEDPALKAAYFEAMTPVVLTMSYLAHQQEEPRDGWLVFRDAHEDFENLFRKTGKIFLRQFGLKPGHLNQSEKRLAMIYNEVALGRPIAQQIADHNRDLAIRASRTSKASMSSYELVNLNHSGGKSSRPSLLHGK